MSGLSAEIGRKIRDAIDFHRGESEEHSRLADDIDDAWQQHDYEWLRGAGVISAADLREIEHAVMAANLRRGRKRASRRNGGMDLFAAHDVLRHVRMDLAILLMQQLGGSPPKDTSVAFDRYERFHTQPTGLGNPYQAFANIKSRRYWASISVNQDLTGLMVQVQIGGRTSKRTKDFYFPMTADVWPEIKRQVTAFVSTPAKNKRTSRRPR